MDLQDFQMNTDTPIERDAALLRHVKDFTLQSKQNLVRKRFVMNSLLDVKALPQKIVSNTLDDFNSRDTLENTLKEQDERMLVLKLMGDRDGHTVGIYQKKSGDAVLFFAPYQGIKTLKDIWELSREIHSTRQVQYDKVSL